MCFLPLGWACWPALVGRLFSPTSICVPSMASCSSSCLCLGPARVTCPTIVWRESGRHTQCCASGAGFLYLISEKKVATNHEYCHLRVPHCSELTHTAEGAEGGQEHSRTLHSTTSLAVCFTPNKEGKGRTLETTSSHRARNIHIHSKGTTALSRQSALFY